MPTKNQSKTELVIEGVRNILLHGGATFTPYPTKVVFNPPVTVVYFNDDSKTVVRCSEDDIFDKEKGLALAIIKRIYGNSGSYNKLFHHFIDKGNAIDYSVIKEGNR